MAGFLRPGWTAEPLQHNSSNEVTGGIWRVHRDRGHGDPEDRHPAPGRARRRIWPPATIRGTGTTGGVSRCAYESGLAAHGVPGAAGVRRCWSRSRSGGRVGGDLAGGRARPAGAERGAPIWARSRSGSGSAQARLARRGRRRGEWLARDWLRGYTLAQPVAGRRGLGPCRWRSQAWSPAVARRAACGVGAPARPAGGRGPVAPYAVPPRRVADEPGVRRGRAGAARLGVRRARARSARTRRTWPWTRSSTG